MVKVKILFLDFDGVLHATSGADAVVPEFAWLPILKNMIAGRADVKVVVHASYRLTSSPEALRQRLGLGKDIWLGVTRKTLGRWPSIQDWVKGRPWIESYRILDDQAYEFPDPAPTELILCDGRRGLSDKEVQAALQAWLEAKP